MSGRVPEKVGDTESSQMYDWINAFLKPFQKAGHTIAHFDGAVCGHIGCVGQTNVVQRDFCFFSSFVFFCQRYQWCRTKRFIFSILKEDTAMYQCIPATKSLQTPFLNNMVVKRIFSLFPSSSLSLFPMVACKQTAQCCEWMLSAPG